MKTLCVCVSDLCALFVALCVLKSVVVGWYSKNMEEFIEKQRIINRVLTKLDCIMDDWKTRLVFERNELMDRHEKLVTFLESDMKDLAEIRQVKLMELQAHAMRLYLDILEQRIERM